MARLTMTSVNTVNQLAYATDIHGITVLFFIAELYPWPHSCAYLVQAQICVGYSRQVQHTPFSPHRDTPASRTEFVPVVEALFARNSICWATS